MTSSASGSPGSLIHPRNAKHPQTIHGFTLPDVVRAAACRTVYRHAAAASLRSSSHTHMLTEHSACIYTPHAGPAMVSSRLHEQFIPHKLSVTAVARRVIDLTDSVANI